MKPLLSFALLALIAAPANFVLAQGPLTPPGAPAPTMKTLDQIEARTPIDTAHTPGNASNQFIITQPGSYYLTGNITGVSGRNGIAINASGVTLDLNGFALEGVAGSLTGVTKAISISPVAVKNGTIRNWGSSGVDLRNSPGSGSNGTLSGLLVTNNGSYGIAVAYAFAINSCSAANNGLAGILTFGQSTITQCTANSNGGTGIDASDSAISQCTSFYNGGDGIGGVNGNMVVTDCVCRNNSLAGINGGAYSVIRGNVVAANLGNGIEISFKSVVEENNCQQNDTGNAAFAGIRGTVVGGNAANRIERNVIGSSATGLFLSSAGNYIAGNTIQGNGDNYNVVAGNQLNILLSEIPESIDWPAQVTLAGALTGISGQNGITVTSDDVTIDLGGHALVGVAGSLKGVLISGFRSNLVIRNGTVRSWGGDGIDASGSANGQFDRLQLSNNGGRGMNIGDRALVTDCAAKSNIGHGIFGGILDTISRCEAALNGGSGISVGESGQIEKCRLNNNSSGGISVISNCVVRENQCDFHSFAAGISVTGARNRIDGNHLTRNQTGITLTVSSANNSVMRNSASGSTGAGPFPAPNYSINGTSNDLGPVGTAATATSPWANLSF